MTKLEKSLKINFKDKNLLKQALTHRSYLNEHPEYQGESNERLEFLGDAILEFTTSDHLYRVFPEFPEGQLTVFRSAIVSTKTLSKVAKSLNLGQFLFMAKGEEEGGGRNNPTLLANTVEAIIGAIFLDQGLKTTQDFIKRHILFLLPQIIRSGAYKDAKSKLQELVQERVKNPPIYKVIKEEGPDHAKIFTVGVFVNSKKLAQGKGSSKQEAEEEAAKTALEKIG